MVAAALVYLGKVQTELLEVLVVLGEQIVVIQQTQTAVHTVEEAEHPHQLILMVAEMELAVQFALYGQEQPEHSLQRVLVIYNETLYRN